MLKKKNQADNVLHNVMTSEIRPKIYAIMLANKEQDYLGISVSFTLEDAIVEVKLKAKNELSMDITTCQTHLWSILSMEELKNKLFAAEVVEAKIEKVSAIRTVGELGIVSKIMKDIVDNNDTILYDKIKNNLNKFEVAYLESKLFTK
jgi:hypothetical protein